MNTSTQSALKEKVTEIASEKGKASSIQTSEDRKCISSGTQVRKHPMKERIVRGLLRISRWYLQIPLFRVGRVYFWKKYCVPYLCWRDTELICRLRFGIRMSLCPREFIQNRILFFDIWEPNITNLFDSFLLPGDVVVDVGANVGYYTLLAAQKIGQSGRVIAVEPNPRVRAKLSRHVELNNLNNVSIVAGGAWDTNTTGMLHVDQDDCGISSLRTIDGGDYAESIQLVRLDDIIPHDQRGRIRLIKIDIEGAEAHALRGLSETLATNPKVRVIAEVNPTMLAALGGSATAVFELMAGFGFKAYLIPNRYEAEAYIPPIEYEPMRPLCSNLSGPAYVLFSRLDPY